jgi:opacity protein-like surface antigen
MKLQRIVLGAVLALALGVGDLRAQRIGLQLDWGSDADLGLGARLEANARLASTGAFSRSWFIGSFDYFFDACNECTYWEINLNMAVPVNAEGVRPYLGGGLNIAHISVDDDDFPGDGPSDTDVGLNLLGGLRFPIGDLSSYLELRGEISGGEQLVLTFGFLLGGR